MDDANGTNRLEAFSDGVFAIAITLLILEIGVPHIGTGDSLWRALWELWPSYLSYAISFVVIGIMWMNHHNMFRRHRPHGPLPARAESPAADVHLVSALSDGSARRAHARR
ncbi:MAG: TMEM175 family protein [Chloroflexota bacterium]|nr:TMEM175 family protein [Chloroflexota bacterium]